MDSLTQGEVVIADRAYDCVLEPIETEDCVIVISPKKELLKTIYYDKDLYRDRHFVENLFAKMKYYHGIATRYDKLDIYFLGAVFMIGIVILLA